MTVTRSMSWAEVWQRRLAAHFLSGPAPREELTGVVSTVCGIHAQVASSAELQLGLRVDGVKQVDVRHALWSARTLVKTYGIRGTLHLFPSSELGLWMAALRHKPPPRQPTTEERERMPPDKLRLLVETIHQTLDGRCLTREELGNELAAQLGPWVSEGALPAFGGQWPLWQLALGPAAFEGLLVFGPNRGNHVTYVRPDQWIGNAAPMDGAEALREVCRRYVRAYGPVTRVELARWLYTAPAAAADLLESIRDELEDVAVEGWRAVVARNAPDPPRTVPRSSVYLLPQFDVYVVGCHPREQLIPPNAPQQLKGGTAAPFSVLLVDGVIGGLWQRSRRGGRLKIRVDPFASLSASQRRDLGEQVARIGHFLNLPVDLEQGTVEPRAHL